MPINTFLPSIAPERQDAAKQYLQAQQQEHLPFIIKLLIVIGAWMSVMVFASMGYMFFIQRTLMMLLIGIIFAAGSLFLHALAETKFTAKPGMKVFLGQVGLALSLIGKTLLIMGVVRYFNFKDWYQVTALVCLVAIAGYPFWKQSADRFMFCVAGFVFIFASIIDQKVTLFTMQYFGMALATGALLVFWGRKFCLYPAAYGALIAAACALGSIYLSFQMTFFRLFSVPEGITALQSWMCNTIIPAVVVAFFYFLYKRKSLKPIDIVAFAGIAVLAWLLSPQVLFSMLVLVIGVYLKENKLRNLGYLFFAASLFMFYYTMHITLFKKSIYLMATGLVLLGGRCLMIWRGYAK